MCGFKEFFCSWMQLPRYFASRTLWVVPWKIARFTTLEFQLLRYGQSLTTLRWSRIESAGIGWASDSPGSIVG
jgi:hypothetical protein